MDIASSVCRRLARINKDYRYGVAFLPGQGAVAFLALLVDRQHGGADDMTRRPGMLFHVGDLRDRLIKFYDKDGSVPCHVPPDKVPWVVGFVGQANSFGNNMICTGEHAEFLEYQGRPKYEWDRQQKEAVRQHGRDLDNFAKDAAADTTDFWKYLARDGTSSDPLFTKEDIRAKFKNPENQNFFKTYENDKTESLEADELRYAGLDK